MIGANIAVMPYVNDSRVRLIGVTSAARSKFLPDMPTLAESGLPGYDFDSWLGLLAPVATSRDIVERIHDAVARVAKNRELKAKLRTQGDEIRVEGPDSFLSLQKSELEKWKKVIENAGIVPN
jgi:tripartite-type tricarboxylate transporter receptor subunit TctC